MIIRKPNVLASLLCGSMLCAAGLGCGGPVARNVASETDKAILSTKKEVATLRKAQSDFESGHRRIHDKSTKVNQRIGEVVAVDVTRQQALNVLGRVSTTSDSVTLVTLSNELTAVVTAAGERKEEQLRLAILPAKGGQQQREALDKLDDRLGSLHTAMEPLMSELTPQQRLSQTKTFLDGLAKLLNPEPPAEAAGDGTE
jgi:hypothetical protein